MIQISTSIDFFRKIQADLELAEFVKFALTDKLRKPHETYQSALHRILDEYQRMIEVDHGSGKT